MQRFAVFTLLISCWMAGCGKGISPVQDASVIDLLSMTPEHSHDAMRYLFARDGRTRQTITLQANSRIALRRLAVPEDAELTFALAMPFNLGDGATARVYFRSDGRETLVFERLLDPARKREDRCWQPVSVDLSPYAGRSGEIVLQASGETGELTGDWVGWGDPQIRIRKR